MFIDTSIVVAILAEEEDASALLQQLDEAPFKVTSALVLLESVMRLSSILRAPPADVEISVRRLFEASKIGFMPITESEGHSAIQAFSAYGKGRGHPAQLNIADCLSYACAKTLGVPLLYKGNDFAATDMA